MLTQIENEYVFWPCLLYDKSGDLLSCGETKRAHIDETRYLIRTPESARGPVIALPRCECGVQTFLKADYSLKEAWNCTVPIRNDAGDLWTYGMRPGHAYNFVAHWMLYERNQAVFAPVLALPPQAMLEEAVHRGLPPGIFYALWFGSLAYNEYGYRRVGQPSVLFLPTVNASERRTLCETRSSSD